MKKLLYLIPLILLALCALKINLYHDTVTYDANAGLQGLKPSHWKMQDYQADVSTDLSQSSSSQATTYASYSQGAKFYGFPFGFYFSNDEKAGGSDLKVSAYSWLWALVDVLIIVFTLLLAWVLNRQKKDQEPTLPPAGTAAAGGPALPPSTPSAAAAPPPGSPTNPFK